MLNKIFNYLKIKWGFFRMNLFYDITNLEYRVRILERAKYWREKYKK
jgi:hypothetical protein|tara:strand:- start:159 stop:299 length:141 start_codon:yes stop_codon:yes gene_type:complete